MKFHLGRGDEATQAIDGGNEAALDDLLHLRLHRLAALLHAFHLFPRSHAICLDLGKEAAILTAEGDDVDIDLVADLDDILCGIRLRISQLFFRNGNLLLVADIDKSLALVDKNDLAFHNLVLPNLRAVLLFFL